MENLWPPRRGNGGSQRFCDRRHRYLPGFSYRVFFLSLSLSLSLSCGPPAVGREGRVARPLEKKRNFFFTEFFSFPSWVVACWDPFIWFDLIFGSFRVNGEFFFTELSQVLLPFSMGRGFFLFCSVLLGFTGFYLVLLFLTLFYCLWPCFTGFYRVFHGFYLSWVVAC